MALRWSCIIPFAVFYWIFFARIGAGNAAGDENDEFVHAGEWLGSCNYKNNLHTSKLLIYDDATAVYTLRNSWGNVFVYNAISIDELPDGRLEFFLPVSEQDVGNENCIDWNMTCWAAVNGSSTTMELNCSGIGCNDQDGETTDFTDNLKRNLDDDVDFQVLNQATANEDEKGNGDKACFIGFLIQEN